MISQAAVTWVAVDISLAVVVIVSMVVACFVWKSYTRKVRKERKVSNMTCMYVCTCMAT